MKSLTRNLDPNGNSIFLNFFPEFVCKMAKDSLVQWHKNLSLLSLK